MSDLRLGDFAAYFEAVHGNVPFPWQRRLMEQVVSEGRWPRLLDLPTGVGKTAAIDVAVFHRALEAALVPRRAPTRIVVVVDRRTIVDQTFERACRIRERLADPRRPGILTAVAERLLPRPVASEEVEVLHTAVLRGGMAREDAWARRPDQPTILVSTVDQVGSRLLFRGYGVSDRMRPIHAGLLGNDTLFLLDEVHLSEPFRQTLSALANRYRGWAEQPLDDRWQVVEMSATPSSFTDGAFRLADDDRKHADLARRLEVPKPVRLVEPVKVSGPEDARIRKLADALSAAALVEGAPAPGKAVGVVVNRVKTARAVFDDLQRRCGDQARVLLMTGRMRPADRTQIQDELRRRVGANRPERTGTSASTIVVATQCIEAGADLDFDVLVTECASWDALKQRFGRLNRIGAAADCRGTILIRSDQVEDADAVYGPALAATWTWLRAKGEELDIGLASPLARELCPPGCLPPKENAPLVLPAHLDSWAQTNPTPEPDPEIALWLHGSRREEAEVQIVWRADLRQDHLVDAGQERLDVLRERLGLCPPSAAEALSLPIHAARTWLAQGGSSADNIPDVPFAGDSDDDEQAAADFRPAIRWRGDDSTILLQDDRIEPGDTLVVPASYGGITAANWDPASRLAVRDVADRVAMVDRRVPVVRLLPEVLEVDFEGRDPPRALDRISDDADESEDAVVADWLNRAYEALETNGGNSSWLYRALDVLRKKALRKVIWIDRQVLDEDGAVLSTGYYMVMARRRVDTTTEDESSSFTGVAVPLEDHLQGVAAWARVFAIGCGLPAPLAHAVEAAARWHDVGKADPRFQLLLHGGDRLKQAVAPALLAKSSASPRDPRARREAALISGYPKGARHELMSVALMSAAPEGVPLPREVDRDLVIHLVASHHGYCRPFAPVAPDPDPQKVEYAGPAGALFATSDHGLASFDSGVSARFFALNRRYGWFGLAWMEAILRLSDHRRSEAEQREGGTS